MSIVKERAHGYAGVTARQTFSETTIAQAVEVAVGKAMTRVMDQLVVSISECIAQVVSNQIAKLVIQTSTGTPESNKLPTASEANTACTDKVNSADNIRDSAEHMLADGQEHVLDLNVSTDVEFDARAQKRSRSPLNCSASTSPQSKPKKSPPSKALKESILEKVVSATILSPK